MAQEIEVKVEIGGADEIAHRIEELGGLPSQPREFEDNRLLDLPGDRLKAEGKLLRVRSTGGRGVVTVKAPAAPAAGLADYKVKREVETPVDDPEALTEVLLAAGFETRWRYQKYRRAWKLDGTTVVVDETPIGNWLEIEGAPEDIDRVAEALGVDRASYNTDSYRDLHERHCAREGIPVGDLVFEDGA